MVPTGLNRNGAVRMRPVLAICAAVGVLLVSATAAAQTGDADIQGRVKEGQNVSITDDQGREFNGRIGNITAKGLTILSRGARQDVPYGEIVRIDRPHDSLANGALIGLAVGAALGFGAIASEDNRSCDPGTFFSCSDPGTGGYVAGAAILGGLGSDVGVGVDALIHRDRNIYRRGGSPRVTLSPAFGRGVRGATVSVSW